MERNFNLQSVLDNIKDIILKISSKPEFAKNKQLKISQICYITCYAYVAY